MRAHGLGHCSAFGYFLRGLVILSHEKLSLVEKEKKEASHFAHLIDATLAFDRTIEAIYSFSSLRHSCPWTPWPSSIDAISSNPDLLEQWACVDARAVKAKLDSISNSPDSWEQSYVGQTRALRPYKILIRFASLFQTTIQRFSTLPRVTRDYFEVSVQTPLLKAFIAVLGNRKSIFLDRSSEAQTKWGALCSLLETFRALVYLLHGA